MTAVARGSVAAGLEPGGRVAVMSRTRYEWTVLDFATWAAGGRAVPVHATSCADQVEWIVRDSGARFVITETPGNTATVPAATAGHQDRPRVRELDAGVITELTALARGPRMRDDVQRAVDHADEAVSRAESIRAFTLAEGEFTEDNGLLAPSLKVKRHAVTARYARETEDLYRR